RRGSATPCERTCARAPAARRWPRTSWPRSARRRTRRPRARSRPTSSGRARRSSISSYRAAPGGTVIALPEAATCPPWVSGNAEGRGYYHVGKAPPGPPSPPVGERLALGFDRAAAIARGELAGGDAVSEIRTLLGAGDPYAAVAALAIAAELDRRIDDATRPAWSAWLAARLGPRLGAGPILAPRTPAERALREAIVAIVPGPRFGRAAVQ